MESVDKYQELIANWGSSTLKPYVDKVGAGEKPEFPKRKVFNVVFTGFTEIMETYEALEFSSSLLSVASPRSKKIAKDQYIKFVVNTYLQDVYILKERLNTYATQIMRMHQKLGRGELAKRHIDPLFPLVKRTFEGLVDTRGGHVHGKRYTDDELTEASSLALIVKHNPEFHLHYDFSVKKVKQEWRNRINQNNIQTLKLLDSYFSALLYVVSEDNQIITP